MFNGEIIFHLKNDTQDVLLLRVKGLIKLLPNSGLKKFCVIFYHAPNILLWSTKCRAGQQLCSNTLKRTNWNVIFLWRIMNCPVKQMTKTHFRYTIWLLISEKNYHDMHVSSSSWMHTQKVSTRHTGKLCTKISNSFSP